MHERLTIVAGSEKVVLGMLDLFPGAELFTTVYDPEPWPESVTGRKVHTSFLDRIPRAAGLYPWLVPLMNGAFESFDMSGFDLVISSSHASAKNVLTEPGTTHVCYCHTPMRYAWEPGLLASEHINPLTRALARPLLGRMRRQDLIAASRPDAYVTNSSHVAARIAKYYRRPARVVPPPVEMDRLLATERAEEGYYLVLGRVVPYKRVETAVTACRRLGRPLKVVGEGRALPQARAAARGGEVEFLGFVDDSELPALFAGARALLFPGEEDFGIVPVEAQAAGTPVVARAAGGAVETVRDGETGVLYPDPSVEGLCEAIRRFETLELEEASIRENARRFTPERFRRDFGDLVAGIMPSGGAGREAAPDSTVPT